MSTIARIKKGQSLKGVYVVVVDDQHVDAELATHPLTKAGATTDIFEDGKEFLEFFSNDSRKKPDIVLLDIQLLGTNGCEVLLEALRSGYFPTTLFASHSGYLGADDFGWLEKIGFDGHFEKTIDRQDFVVAIKKLVDNKQHYLSQRDPYKFVWAAISELSALRLRAAVLENDYIKKLISPRVFQLLDSDPRKLAATSKQVAIGFVDVRSFVQLMNRSELSLIDDTLKLFFDFASERILQRGGFIDKFIGDAVMWFHQDDDIKKSAEACLDVSLSLVQELHLLTKEIGRKLHFNIPLKIGVGAACGTCAVGIFGSPKYRIQYTVIGPAVNLASRLCSDAKADQILIGGSIIEHCTEKTRKIGFRKIKGFDHEVEVRSVVISPKKSRFTARTVKRK